MKNETEHAATHEPCHFCNADILVSRVENEEVPVNDFGEPFCTAECLKAHEDNQNESAYERYLESYYGGDVATLEEQYQAAAEQKRRLS